MKQRHGVKMDTYTLPQEVMNSLPLRRSTEYTWNGNTIRFFYNDTCTPHIQHVVNILQEFNSSIPVKADIILSPVKKRYPVGRVFGPSHVNTGYCDGTKIVVYREEEWFKVFIHECIHYFKYDAELFDPSLTSRILRIFPVDSDVNIYEAYCEFTARMLNCKYVAKYANLPFADVMKRERKHSMRHMVNVLFHMGLTYDSIQDGGSCYKEETSLLSYVVLTNILMNNGFMHTPDKVVPCIEQNYNNPCFLKKVYGVYPHVTTTMSIISVDDF